MMSFKSPLKLITVLLIAWLGFSAFSYEMPVYQIIVFEGSDWCVKCMSLEKEVLSDSTFINYLEKQGIELSRIDFPQRKKQKKSVRRYNESVAETYNFDGVFPTLVFVNHASDEISKIYYDNRSSEELIQIINRKIE